MNQWKLWITVVYSTKSIEEIFQLLNFILTLNNLCNEELLGSEKILIILLDCDFKKYLLACHLFFSNKKSKKT